MPRRQHRPRVAKSAFALAVLAASLPATAAQTCISLQGSTTCPSFSNASVSTSLSGELYVQPRVRPVPTS